MLRPSDLVLGIVHIVLLIFRLLLTAFSRLTFPVWSCLPAFPSNYHTRSLRFLAELVLKHRHYIGCSWPLFHVSSFLFLCFSHWSRPNTGYCSGFSFPKDQPVCAGVLCSERAFIAVVKIFQLKYKEMSIQHKMLVVYFFPFLHVSC